jgi:hypothetical protein
VVLSSTFDFFFVLFMDYLSITFFYGFYLRTTVFFFFLIFSFVLLPNSVTLGIMF